MAGGKSLKESAQSNPTALGDPVSLKAEKSNNEPTEQDRPNKAGKANSESDSDKKSLKDIAQQDLSEAKKGNRSMLGDPVSLKAETSDKDPVKGSDRGDQMGNITDRKDRDSKL
ncbi:hypothetical protein LTR99_005932 [Exophiala xenobiotica]|uniref:Uncharacterized protein n=1 Tax=Vermiconidia calcicola TaxID=1690605 RepID=A0AAV9QCX6_9PEZI|nr:hypothetical protein H2202_000194 [Exophiala xenobiotica]KAK5540995.1 hypothetical protein LTR25_002772 [Vermiconidia calcicola]KAK5549513.1 hypothetical protein LTR23_000621 [Chaetothyriales sp. CCFEE 6169]KAK5193838.1 hypothetical protein LTR92_006178 [Exophiala xenobiotica]KAK5208135.1 hypothetical protein LTR41_006071 [Exophiala xenobiotica]